MAIFANRFHAFRKLTEFTQGDYRAHYEIRYGPTPGRAIRDDREHTERHINKNTSKPGTVKATLDSNESKQTVMKHMNKLKDSSRYNKALVENDIPAAQRAINANFRTLLNALGESNLQLRGSRISAHQDYQQREDHPCRDYSGNTESYDRHETRDDTYRRREHPRDNDRTRNVRRDTRYNH